MNCRVCKCLLAGLDFEKAQAVLDFHALCLFRDPSVRIETAIEGCRVRKNDNQKTISKRLGGIIEQLDQLKLEGM